MAYRDISEAEYREWSAIYDQAAATINGRGEALDKAAEIIEKDLFLLGATAIEDKLQEGVPDTIHTLQMAGIKVWVLTGDRQETAINIGLSCRLISESMNLVIVNEESALGTKEFISKRLSAITSQRKSGELEDLALIIGLLWRPSFWRMILIGYFTPQTVKAWHMHLRKTSQRHSSNLLSCARPSFAVSRLLISVIFASLIPFCRSCFTASKGTRRKTGEEKSKSDSLGYRRRSQRC